MTPRCAYVLRSLLVAEFAAALGTWAFADLPWWLACMVATTSLTVFLLTYPDPHGPGEASERMPAGMSLGMHVEPGVVSQPFRERLCLALGCDMPDRGPCHRCGRW